MNADYTTAQGDRLKKEAAYDSVTAGSLDAALATPQGESLRKLAEHLNEARENLAEVESFYGANHPEYRQAQAKLDDVQASFEATRAGYRPPRGGRVSQEAQQREGMAQQAVAEAKTDSTRSTRALLNTRPPSARPTPTRLSMKS